MEHMRRRPRSKYATVELIGWIGVALILAAYVLLSTGYLAGQSIPYQSMMLIGSGSIALEAWKKRDKQPMVLNLVFMGIALASLVTLLVKQ
jgi:hypothetical protein